MLCTLPEKYNKKQKAFSLIELLLCLVIFLIFISSFIISFSIDSQSNKKLTKIEGKVQTYISINRFIKCLASNNGESIKIIIDSENKLKVLPISEKTYVSIELQSVINEFNNDTTVINNNNLADEETNEELIEYKPDGSIENIESNVYIQTDNNSATVYINEFNVIIIDYYNEND